MIEKFIIFSLAATGITLVLVKSKLFRSVRERFTKKHDALKSLNAVHYDNKGVVNIIKERALWLIDSILNCSLCMGVWASAACVFLVWAELWTVLWWLAGITVVGLLTKFYEKWMC